MKKATMQQEILTPTLSLPSLRLWQSSFRLLSRKQAILLIFTVLLLLGSFLPFQQSQPAQAANPGYGKVCRWHRVAIGDTLNRISTSYRVNIWTLARANRIHNINLIYAGHSICVPVKRHARSYGASGLLPNGQVRWYAYNALEWSTSSQASRLLRQAAARYGLPANLLLAIAWQESGWRQHVISRDGGIGLMQIMPYTALVLNKQTGIRHDPYKLWDNIELGAFYLYQLWRSYHGNITYVVSAYNEGGWNVQHRGIFNWRYVNNVRALMYRFY
ncbi:MAG TPA: transglycosylase SLT domain-containing protein [Dictyobacter sp.]|jgi:hypothetical protein|nr:transglycosylase SLT domain-containing protein [Dictyobacter sp.]